MAGGGGRHSLLCGGEYSLKMRHGEEGVEQRVRRRGRKRTSVVGHMSILPTPHPLPIACSMLLAMTSLCWEEMGSFSFKCLPKKRDGGLSSHSMVSQKKKKNEAASRLGTPLLAFFFLLLLHSSLSGSEDTRPTAAADFPQSAACCCPGLFW